MSDESEPMEPAVTPRTLHRSTQGLVGGVAKGLADRYDLDVKLIRLGFVLTTVLWGFGLALYLALWVVLPRGEGGVPSETLAKSASRRLALAVVAAVVFFGVLVLLLWHPVPRFGPGVSLTWLVLLVVLAVIALRSSSRRLSFRRMVALLLLGALSVMILLVGAFMWFLESTGVPLAGGNGLHTWSPISLAQVRSTYRTEFGATTLDLSHVQFPAAGFAVKASTAVGSVNVMVPADAVVTLTTSVGIGNVTFSQWNGSRWTGPFSETPPSSGVAKSARPHLVLDIQVGIGHVNVERGS
ncbi:MAG TPA: PspC domain-containing protein [Acidimicrobiales bacterium]|nr:PspC domain-containing protein [Acidimicrobiales bacterium]